MEIDGKDAEGKPIHWVFNLDGRIEGPAKEFNMSCMMLEFFQAHEALPSTVLGFDHIRSTDAELLDSPYIKTVEGDRYTILSMDRYLQSIKLPPHIEGKIFTGRYYNNRTGMLDYFHYQTFSPPSKKTGRGGVIEWRRNSEGRIVRGEGDRYFNPEYEDPSVPLPEHGWGTQYWKNIEIKQGIFLPIEYARVDAEGISQKATYSNIRIKRV
jgi:hypothetical protein